MAQSGKRILPIRRDDDERPRQDISNPPSNVNSGPHQEKQSSGPSRNLQPTYQPRASQPRVDEPRPIQSQNFSFKERVQLFERQSGPPTCSTKPASDFSTIVEPSTSPTLSFQTAAESNLSIPSTRTEYSRSGDSELWEQFLETGTPDFILASAAPGSGHQYCACSNCVWAKTSRVAGRGM